MTGLLMALLAAAPLDGGFPTLRGRNLAGENVRVPAAFPGKVLLVCMGFTRESQYEVEPWAAIANEAFGSDARFAVLEMPMYSGAARVFRPFIDRGMARATPARLHGNVITSTDVDEAVQGLRLGSTDRAAVVLVDETGTVRFLARGAPTAAERERFLSVLRGLR